MNSINKTIYICNVGDNLFTNNIKRAKYNVFITKKMYISDIFS